MTRSEMFKRIREKLDLKKSQRLPKPDKIPTKLLLEVGLEKWQDMKNHLKEIKEQHYSSSHYPFINNCSLCYKFFLNKNIRCPLSLQKPCCGTCIPEYYNFDGNNSIENINKVIKRLKKELKKR